MPGAGRQTGREERRREGANGPRPGPPHVPRYPADTSKKNPQRFRRGKVGGWLVPTRRPDPSPAKGDPGKLPVGPVSWLPVTNLLSAPSRRISPSGIGADFVAGYSCGAAMDFHHLPDTRIGRPTGNSIFHERSTRYCVAPVRGSQEGRPGHRGIAKTLPLPVAEKIGDHLNL